MYSFYSKLSAWNLYQEHTYWYPGKVYHTSTPVGISAAKNGIPDPVPESLLLPCRSCEQRRLPCAA